MSTQTPSKKFVCAECESPCRRFGKNRNGSQRYRCNPCGKTYTEERERPLLGSMTVPVEKATLALQLLLEGTSVRSAERITGLHRDTILRLLVLAGERCEKLLGQRVRNVPVTDVQCDEIWGYVFKKEGHKAPEESENNGIGDAYTFVAIERNTKLVLNFALGRRDQLTTNAFIEGLRDATAPQRFQLTTDGFGPYAPAIDSTLEDRVDYAMVVKHYSETGTEERRYSPARWTGSKKKIVLGSPKRSRISTSHVERQNLTMRMQIRRLTRLTNGFSKKWENLWAAVCLHFAYYNFCRIHRSLRVTPAMESGIADRVWSIEDLLSS